MILNQFTDATPFEDGCDRETCTQPVGGDHSERCQVWCESCGEYHVPGETWPSHWTESEKRLMDGNR